MLLKKIRTNRSESSEQGLSTAKKKSELSKGVNDLKGMTSVGKAGLLHSGFLPKQ
jgi:hypothetical protein